MFWKEIAHSVSLVMCTSSVLVLMQLLLTQLSVKPMFLSYIGQLLVQHGQLLSLWVWKQ